MDERKTFINSEAVPFILLFLLSLAVRVYASATSIAHIYPDEIFQTVEAAHKLAFGNGITTWEFEVGARCWFLPGILAGVYKALNFLGVEDPLSLNIGIKIFLSIFHSLAVSVIYLIFRKRQIGQKEAFLFSLPLAASYLLSFISVRTLSESASLPFMVFALYHASSYLETEDKKQLAFSVLASGIAYMIRFQTGVFAFGIAAALFCVSKKRLKAALAFGFGFIGMMLLQGLLDLVTWGSFWQSAINYFNRNVLQGLANTHGTYPWYTFIKDIVLNFHPLTWISASALMLISFIKPNKFKQLFLFSFPFFFFFAVHSMFAHKEPRFIFACHFAMFALSCAFFALLCQRYAQKRKTAAIIISLVLLSALDTMPHVKFYGLWNSTVMTDDFYGNGKDSGKRFNGLLETEAELGRINDLKHAYIFGVPQIWSGGYAYFHKDAKLSFIIDNHSAGRILRRISGSGEEGNYFVFMNDAVLPEEKDLLEKRGGTNDFTIYRFKGKPAEEAE